MRFWILSLAFAGVAVIFGIGFAFGVQYIRLMVNGQAVPNASWTVQNGQVNGPVAPVAKALGADVYWDARAGVLTIDSPSTWVHVNREPNWGYNAPYDFMALGPILTVRHALAGQQWASLTKPENSQAPLLVRYEIVDANSEDMMVPPGTTGKAGFTVLAYLYWAYMDPKRDVPRGGARIIVSNDKGGTGYFQEGQRLQKMRLDVISFEVVPNKVNTMTPSDNPLPGVTNVQAIVQGETGWIIAHQYVLSSKTSEAGHTDFFPPVYDISIQQVKPTTR